MDDYVYLVSWRLFKKKNYHGKTCSSHLFCISDYTEICSACRKPDKTSDEQMCLTHPCYTAVMNAAVQKKEDVHANLINITNIKQDKFPF